MDYEVGRACRTNTGEGKRNAHEILMGNLERKKKLERP
jgi:hypothetical protein